MVKKVYKYATGAEVPEGAIYLSTQVETFAIHYKPDDVNTNETGYTETKNQLVWHYFLVDVDEE